VRASLLSLLVTVLFFTLESGMHQLLIEPCACSSKSRNTRNHSNGWPTPHFCSYGIFLQICGACDVGYAFFQAWAIHLGMDCMWYGVWSTVRSCTRMVLYYILYTSGELASWSNQSWILHRPKTKTQRRSSTGCTPISKIYLMKDIQPNRKSSGQSLKIWLIAKRSLLATLTNCLQKNAPVWPLENFVAVNNLFGILLG